MRVTVKHNKCIQGSQAVNITGTDQLANKLSFMTDRGLTVYSTSIMRVNTYPYEDRENGHFVLATKHVIPMIKVIWI